MSSADPAAGGRVGAARLTDMELPNNEIGVSDTIDYGECPRRMSFKMRRHTEAGEAPEALNWTNAYGSAVHDGIAFLEDNPLASDEDALLHVVKKYGAWIGPEEHERIREDLALYRERDYTGVKTVLNEGEIRVPLMEHNGKTIYFRGRIDRLYQRRDNPGIFIHIDYKSSRWPKTQEEVDSDPQMWSYNFALHEFYPEIETLVQNYDQLRYGVLRVQRKNDRQRRMIRDWLRSQVTALLEDDETGPDGLLIPRKNEWCPWCPIMESCPVVRDLTDFGMKRIEALAPSRKEGRKVVVDLDANSFDIYVRQLEDVKLARKVLERFEKEVNATLAAMPQDERERLGYKLWEKRTSVFVPEAIEAAHGMLGDDRFYSLVSMSKTAVEKLDDSPERSAILDMADRVAQKPQVKKA